MATEINWAAVNNDFLFNALNRNDTGVMKEVKRNSQTIDIEVDQFPGWLHHIDLQVLLNLKVTVGAGGSKPRWSQFAPFNFFQSVAISLGGGPFQHVNPYFYYLREAVMRPGWKPDKTPYPYSYATNKAWNTPDLQSTVGSTVDNQLRFCIRIPLQVQHGTVMGHIPMGNPKVKMKIRLTVAPEFYGADEWLNPIVGGSLVSAVVDPAKTSWVVPAYKYRTTPATRADMIDPKIGFVLNIQTKDSDFVAAGSDTPIKFSDPFRYLRLWHIVIDGTGSPNSEAVNGFELDLTPGYEQFNFRGEEGMMDYFNETHRRYRQNLPTGVFVFDLWAGSDPANPNDTQSIDGAQFATLQTKLSVAAGTNIQSPAKIITIAEALSPVGF